MITMERTYNIPLRKEFLKVPKYKRAKKTVKAIKEFLVKHMKSEDVRIGKHLNLKVWEHGMRNPPHHVKVTAIKDDKGVVRAELFGIKEEKKTVKKESPAKAEKKREPKTSVKKTEVVKEAKPKEESKEAPKSKITKAATAKKEEKQEPEANKAESSAKEIPAHKE